MKKTNPYPLATKKNQARFTNVAWRYEVANGDTQLGYLDWVEHQVEASGDGDLPKRARDYDPNHPEFKHQ